MKKLLSLVLALCMMAACGVAFADETTPEFTFCISHMTNAFTVTAANAMEEAGKAAGAKVTVVEAAQDINTQIGQIEMAVNTSDVIIIEPVSVDGVLAAVSNAMEAAAEAAGAKMTVVEAAQDINTQIGQIEMAVNTSDVIIIEPVSVDGVLAAVSNAMEAGVPVVVFNQAISDPSRAAAFCGVSNADLGYMEMKRAIEDMGGAGNVALLLGPLGSDGQLGRSAGYEKAIAETNGAVKVVFEETANWTTEEALKLAENWLQTGTEINAFVCQNDGMAMGAVKACEDKGLAIKCYGLDATDDALNAIKEGRLELSVSQNTEAQAQACIDCAMLLWKGEECPAEVMAEGMIIDASNVDQYL